MSQSPAIEVVEVSHRYGARLALDRVSLAVRPGEFFALLGPNGGGKTTLFRLVSTQVQLQSGVIRVGDCDVQARPDQVRRRLGVVFQMPSLDRELTVRENLACGGHLAGLWGRELARRIDEELARFHLSERAGERCKQLSGGLRRRVELAKALLPRPSVLVLDEPSTGLDPAARRELRDHLRELTRSGVTVALTTHLFEEAEAADRIAILARGRLVACDTAERLRATIGGDTLSLETAESAALAAEVAARWGVPARAVEGAVRLEVPAGHEWITRLVEAYPGRFTAIRLAKPSLEDVFVARTGESFAVAEAAEASHG